MTVLERPWGQEVIFSETPTYCGKILRRKAGTKGDVQFHVKAESHYLQEGTLIVRVGQHGTLKESVKHAGDAWHVPPGVVHQEEAVTDCVEFEVAEPTREDRVRMEAAYGLPSEGGLPSMSVSEAVATLRRLAAQYATRATACEAWADQMLETGTIEPVGV